MVLVALAGSACRSQNAEFSDASTEIVFKHAKHPRSAALAAIIRQFEQEHPRVRIREEVLPAGSDEQHQFYVINLAARAGDFDVLDMDVIWVPEFARAGWLEELTPHFGDTALTRLHPAAFEADWLEERLYGLPWFVDVGVLYYRKDLLAKYGYRPPETYEQLLKASQEILRREAQPGLMGFIWQGKQYEGLVCTALEFIRGNGGDLFDRQGHPSVTSSNTLQALQFMEDLIRQTGVTPPLVATLDEEAARHIFQSGRAIFMRNWPYAWGLLNAPGSTVAGRVGIIPVPHFEGHRSAPTLGGFHVGVNAYSRHKAAAIEFARFLVRRDVQKQIATQLGVLPADTELYQDPEVQAVLPLLADLLPSLRLVQARPVTPYYMSISQIVQPEFSAVVAGVRSPRQAMSRVDTQLNHLLRTP